MSICQQLCSSSNPIMISYGLSQPAMPITFSSPKTPLYSITPPSDFLSHGSLEQEVSFHSFLYPSSSQYNFPWLKLTSYRIKHYTNSNYITLLHIHNLNNSSPSPPILPLYSSSNNDSIISSTPPSQKYIILYSHGANDDLGSLLSFLMDLSTQSGLDVISYDYLGVGCSSGKQHSHNLFTDIIRVIDFIQYSLRYSLSNIMLMGESIGCISVTHVICEQKYSKIPFIVLISPCLTEDLIEKANHVESTVLLIQGKRDDHYIVKNIKRYESKLKTVWRWYPKNAGRMDLLVKYRRKFYLKIKGFIDTMKGNNVVLKFDETDNSITRDDISEGENKKGKMVKAIKNYVHTEDSVTNKGKGMNLKKMPSVNLMLIEANQSQKYSQGNSLGSVGGKGSDNYNEGEDIFSLKKESMKEEDNDIME